MTSTLHHVTPIRTPDLTALAPDPACIAVVTASGQLRLPAAPGNATTTAMHRRTRTGTAYRIDLGDGIACWLDGDQHDGSGELNWVATQMCSALSGGTFAGPHDAPFVCGLVMFTAASGPTALSERQLRRVVDAHATADDELCDAGHLDTWTDTTAVPAPSPLTLV
nr:hypothetical protein GCM10020063_009030 [Dactylosporangium thailandense]